MPEVATPNQAEREFETGTDESFKNTNATAGAAVALGTRSALASANTTAASKGPRLPGTAGTAITKDASAIIAIDAAHVGSSNTAYKIT